MLKEIVTEDMEHFCGKTEDLMTDTGLKGNLMGLEISIMKMVINIKVNLFLVKEMELENIPGKTVIHMMGTGNKESLMELENIVG